MLAQAFLLAVMALGPADQSAGTTNANVPMDQTLNVSKGTKLDVSNFAGDVSIKAWDKDQVRVEVIHSQREVVDVKQGEGVVTVRARAVRGGRPRSLDFTITVPKWMPIAVNGTYADVTMDGVGADVSVETTQGDINITGGSGVVTLKSIQGEVVLQKAKGRIEVRAVNEGMRLADLSGDLSAETTNGSIILDRIDSGNVDLYTVNGNISYDGPIKDKGLYRLTTHNGLIAMAVPDKVNATLTVRTYNGSFRSTFPLPAEPNGEARRKRFTLNLGNGSAHVELESFGGTIALRRPGEARPEVEREKRRKEQQSRQRVHDEPKEHQDHVGPDLEALNAQINEQINSRINSRINAQVNAINTEVNARVNAQVNDQINSQINSQINAEINAAVNEALAAVPHPFSFSFPMPKPKPQPRRP